MDHRFELFKGEALRPHLVPHPVWRSSHLHPTPQHNTIPPWSRSTNPTHLILCSMAPQVHLNKTCAEITQLCKELGEALLRGGGHRAAVA